jgi:TP53 regulating kinase-like protein
MSILMMIDGYLLVKGSFSTCTPQIKTNETKQHVCKIIAMMSKNIATKPPRYHNSTWQLISQGAEARIWLVPNYLTINDGDNQENTTKSVPAICKERFAKTYRHPVLNDTLTRARTKSEARSLIRCRRGGVNVPIVLGVDIPNPVNADKGRSTKQEDDVNGTGDLDSSYLKEMSNTSSCLFLENIDGCTVRSFLNLTSTDNSQNDGEIDEPPSKKLKVDCDEVLVTKQTSDESTSMSLSTRVDEVAKIVAHAIGIAIGKMHNTNIIHGDLTTSNIFLRNPVSTNPSIESKDIRFIEAWKPDIVLIDFGLSSTSVSTASKKKSASCHEERAVDLYVLERAFITTHAGGETLVDEILRGYKSSCTSSDSVFQRLSQVRLRGRKRECFG